MLQASTGLHVPSLSHAPTMLHTPRYCMHPQFHPMYPPCCQYPLHASFVPTLLRANTTSCERYEPSSTWCQNYPWPHVHSVLRVSTVPHVVCLPSIVVREEELTVGYLDRGGSMCRRICTDMCIDVNIYVYWRVYRRTSRRQATSTGTAA